MISKMWLLLFLPCAACTQSVEGLHVDLGLVNGLQFDDNQKSTGADGIRTINTDEGMTIYVTAAFVTVSSIQLIPCDTALSSTQKVALHGESSALVMAVPHVTGLWLPDYEVWSVGLLEPPPDRYCKALVEFDVADDDAVALPDSVDMVDRSLYVSGQCDDGSTIENFEVATQSWSMATIALADETGQSGILVSEEQPEVQLNFGFAYGAWFDGVDWSQDEESVALAILNNVSRSVVQLIDVESFGEVN